MGPYMQFLHACFAIGTVFGPLVVGIVLEMCVNIEPHAMCICACLIPAVEPFSYGVGAVYAVARWLHYVVL